MKDAYEQLAEAKKKEAEAATRVAREAELGKLRARSELLGLDRWGRRYWRIDGAGQYMKDFFESLITNQHKSQD